MQIRPIGVSGSTAGPDSPASCYLISVSAAAVAAGIVTGEISAETEVRDWHLVVDLGSGAMGPLGSSIHPPKIDAVLISHFHPDHFFDLSGLYVQLKYHPEFGSHYSGVAPLLPVFGPSDVAQVLREVIEGDDDGGVFSPHPYPVETPFQIGPFTVTVTMAYHVIESYSLRITGPSSQKLGETAVLAYTGDTDYCPALVSLTQGADLFLAEAAFMECRDSASPRGLHLTGRQAGQVAREAQVQRLALTHIPPWGDPKVAESEAKQEFAGEITVAKPHVVYTI